MNIRTFAASHSTSAHVTPRSTRTQINSDGPRELPLPSGGARRGRGRAARAPARRRPTTPRAGHLRSPRYSRSHPLHQDFSYRTCPTYDQNTTITSLLSQRNTILVNALPEPFGRPTTAIILHPKRLQHDSQHSTQWHLLCG